MDDNRNLPQGKGLFITLSNDNKYIKKQLRINIYNICVKKIIKLI